MELDSSTDEPKDREDSAERSKSAGVSPRISSKQTPPGEMKQPLPVAEDQIAEPINVARSYATRSSDLSPESSQPGRVSKELSHEGETNGGAAEFLSKPWWLGIGAIAGMLALGGAVAAIIAILPADGPAARTSDNYVQFANLNQITIYRYGIVFSYPSSWDQQSLPTNGDGVEFLDPNDRAVTITAYGASTIFGQGPTYSSANPPTIYDVEKGWRSYILGLKNARIISEAATGTTIVDGGTNYPLDAWRVIYQYTNDSGSSMTDMVKTAYASGREVDLVMESPTKEFQRYEPAFLQLSEELRVLVQCEDCSAS